ncbi:SRPBCC family protein [Georgenia ruanii]|uniref:SRPBCC domain-containing protein n=1 Tax=Georgenia ruanii TaxID=348442 RepID=A0A7J9UZE8_9MICO|nr:SRPBCC domain-containing protein [Georgenia ruanii]MPV89064.1 SRPBCC domain-containing protein [Georgenia ruanii]
MNATPETSAQPEAATSVVIEQSYPHAPAVVWQALTTPELMARWLMTSQGFAPEVGRRFTMQGRPMEAARFSGVVASTVLEVTAPHRLSLSWDDAHADRPTGWVVTWELRAEGDGTRLLLTHSGFDPDDATQQVARRIMSGGWAHILGALGRVLGG